MKHFAFSSSHLPIFFSSHLRIFFSTFLLFSFSTFLFASDEDYALELFSQHLDNTDRNPYSYGASYFPDTVFGSYGSTDVVRASADLRIFKFDGFIYGSLDLWAFGDLVYFIDNPNMSSLPDALLAAGLDLGYTLRFINGWSTELRAAPGIYSDVVEPAFGCPLTLNLYFAADPTLSFQIGGTYRNGWDVPFMPNVGIVWQPCDEIRIEAGVPKSKITLFNDYILSPFATFEWRNTTYALSGKEGVPENMSMDEMTVSAGLALSPMRTWKLIAECGTFIHRHINADVDENTVVDLSKDPFFRVMIKSGF